MKKRRVIQALFVFLMATGLVAFAAETKKVLVITVNGIINPVSAEYIIRSIKEVDASGEYEALVIELDTPGGLDTSMRKIIKAMQAAKTPVVVFVAPSGSRAASAGAFITMSAHVAAMSPGSSIGAASPVAMGGEGMSKTMKKKVTNDAAAYLRSLAEAHGRSGEWGDKFVRKGSSLSETEALKENVIDLLADNTSELLTAIDGRKVKTEAGIIVLATKGATIKRSPMTWRENFFDMLANPNIAYLLMMLGFYGLMFELSNPGAVLPGVIGAICLVLAFYSLQTLPINYAGALLILLAFIMFLLEVWVQSYGMLTIGGIAALLVGSLMLVDSPEEYLRISLMIIVPVTLLTASFFIFLIGSGIRAQYRPATIGLEAMAGAVGVCDRDILSGIAGKVFVGGDLWDAVSEEEIKKGIDVEVVRAKGLTLTVKKRT